jgi:hypothetical protein
MRMKDRSLRGKTHTDNAVSLESFIRTQKKKLLVADVKKSDNRGISIWKFLTAQICFCNIQFNCVTDYV